MEKLKVGLVGVSRGSGTVAPFAIFPETEITALCDLDEKRLAECSDHYLVPEHNCFTEYGQFIDTDLDIVVVGTPIQLHAEQTVQALEAGKHVLSEVTMAYTIEDCQRIIELVKKTGFTYMMGENCCYMHFVRQWKELCDAKKIGDVFYAEAEYIHNIQGLLVNQDSGEAYWRLTRPPIYYCTHSLGPLMMLTGDHIVAAMGLDAGYSILPALGEGCLNMEVALFKTARGAIFKLLRSQVAYREPSIHYYSLYGTQGFLENNRTNGFRDHQGKFFNHNANERYQEIECLLSDPDAPPEAHAGGHGTSEYYMVRDFINAVTNNSPSPIDAVLAAKMTAPGIIAHESAKLGGRWFDVPVFHW